MTIETQFLFRMILEAECIEVLGRTPHGCRSVVKGRGGTVEGPRIRGRVPRGAAALVLDRDDGVTETDVRLTIETDDAAIILMTYRGIRSGPAAVLDRIRTGEPVDPSEYYFRIAGTFETTAGRYDWLNRIIAVGTGHRLPNGLDYSVFGVV